MPSYVITEKCDSCAGQDKTACMYICPHDLMALKEQVDPITKKVIVNPETNNPVMKAVNQEPVQCWECYSCVKICPQQAISIRCYADFAPLGGEVIPMLGSDSIMWTVKFRNGNIKRFKFPSELLKLEAWIFLQELEKLKQIFRVSKLLGFTPNTQMVILEQPSHQHRLY